jgi:acetyl esterase/lipase
MRNGLTEEILSGPAADLYRQLVPGIPCAIWAACLKPLSLWEKMTTLCDDGIDFANRAFKVDAPVQLHIGEKMPHGFHMQDGIVPQAAAAAEQVILNFLKTSSLP